MTDLKAYVDKYDAVALMSGGLDSILAMRVVMDQGLKVLGLHFCSPFYGHPEDLEKWHQMYGVDVVAVDISEAMMALIKEGPKNGFGSALNPCTDCHTLMATRAREIMEEIHAKFIISGEVMWQRPMSQRPDAMNIVHRDSNSKGYLLRPLSALKLEPTEVEKSGLVDRNRLLGIYGRGRVEQLQLAKDYGFPEIPPPGGGCILTEKNSSARLWVIFNEFKKPHGEDFKLAQAGRFLYYEGHILAISKTIANADLLESCQKDSDVMLEMLDYNGPLTLGRSEGEWSEELIYEAAALTAGYAGREVRELPEGTKVRVSLKYKGEERILNVLPTRQTHFQETRWEDMTKVLRQINQQMTDQRLAEKREKFYTWVSRKKQEERQNPKENAETEEFKQTKKQ